MIDIDIKPWERIDSLDEKHKIIQDTRGFLYGTDAVLLSKFAKIKNKDRVLDLCSGSGIIPVLFAINTECKNITGLEYFSNLTDMASRTVKLNGFEERVSFITADLKDIKKHVSSESFDVVTVNPPYKNDGSGIQNENEFKKIARHEILCTLDDCVKSAAFALKYGGKLYMVHRADRLADVIYAFKSNKIEPKTLTLVMPKPNASPKLLLIEGKKGGGSELKLTPPLILGE
ncbi:MAG: tRNA1(Val) (adenine(37)-N6)-methyltransferase [Clostridia bacterium]|nr:tRNA1(Val) (adenine(37)-N6)-methyltransferase [Clostridia bacterium]